MVVEPLESAELANGARLPSVSGYLRAVLALGWASFRPSWPLLLVIAFFQKWMESYLKLMKEEGEMSLPWFTGAGLLVGLLVLLDAPLLVLQDSVLRGNPRSLWDSCRATWTRLRAFLTCWAIEGLILFVLPLLVFLVPLLRSMNSSPSFAALAAMWALVGAACVGVAAVLSRFADPLVLLDSKRPLDAIRLSISTVAPHFGGVLGRLLLFCLGAGLFYGLLLLPFLLMGILLDQLDAKTIEIAPILLYELAATAFLASCSVSALLVLYRSLKPYGDSVRATTADVSTQPMPSE